MLFEIRKESQAFLELAGKALKGTMNPEEKQQLNRLLKDRPDLRREFLDLQQEVSESKLAEIWERGLRVLLGVPQSGDQAFLESEKNSDTDAWHDFLRGAYVLKVMAESTGLPVPASVSNEMTAEEEKQLFTAVREAQAKRKQAKPRPPSK
jgi:hypothetical protein